MGLTVLSFGAGQESTWLLYACARHAWFRERWAPGELLVIGCDTGDEHPETYEHVRYCAEFCQANGIPFLWVTAAPGKVGYPTWAVHGFHTEAWPSLLDQYRRNSSMGSRQYARTCTDNLKISNFYKALAWHVAGRPVSDGLPNTLSRDRVFSKHTAEHGRIRVMLGFAKGEERRMEKTKATLARTGKGALPRWRRESFELVFPLIEDPETNFDRAQTQAAMRAMGLPVPVPSNCLRCHFRGPIELLWLARNHPMAFEEWVQIEKPRSRNIGRSVCPTIKTRAYTENGCCAKSWLRPRRNTAT